MPRCPRCGADEQRAAEHLPGGVIHHSSRCRSCGAVRFWHVLPPDDRQSGDAVHFLPCPAGCPSRGASQWPASRTA